MLQYLSIIKGIHPGLILDRELKLRKISKADLAQKVQEHAQTIGAITKGKRRMNIALALKIEQILGIEEGFFMILQVYYDIEQEKKREHVLKPDITKLRSALFWDTSAETIDWVKQKNAVIVRVFERGNAYEQAEITRFYGQDAVNEAIAAYGRKSSL